MVKWFYYIRVSTKNQNLERQLQSPEFIEFCKRHDISPDSVMVMEEKQTGKDFNRPIYKLLKSVVREGDCIIVSSIDRFGRNYKYGRKEFAELMAMGVKVYPLNRPMIEDLYKMDDNISKFMLNFLVDWELMSAEEELKISKQRQKEGIEIAKQNGKYLGRPKVTFPHNFGEVYEVWKSGKITAKKAMEYTSLKRTSFYKLVNKYEKDIKDARKA